MMNCLSTNENPLLILPSLARLIGLNEAIVLQQIHSWLSTSEDIYAGRKRISDCISSCQKQFPFWSESTIKRTLRSLKEKGLIICGNYTSYPGNRTKWWSINYAALESLQIEK